MPTAQRYIEPENDRFTRRHRVECDPKEGTPVAVGSTRPEPVDPMDCTREPSARGFRARPPSPTPRANPGQEWTRPLLPAGALETGEQRQNAHQIESEPRTRTGQIHEPARPLWPCRT